MRFGPHIFERRAYDAHAHVSMCVHNIALYNVRVHIMFKCVRARCACVCVYVCARVLPMRYELVMIQLITGVYIGTTMHYNLHAFTTARYIDFKAAGRQR